MRNFLVALPLAILLLAACAPAPTPVPTSTPTVLPNATSVPAPTATQRAIQPTLTTNQVVFEQVWTLVRDKWVYNDDFRGMNWQQVHDEYAPRVASAATPESFYALMQELIQKLDDHISRFSSSQEVALTNQPQSGTAAYGGIGATLSVEPEGGVVLQVVQGAPADLAGLKTGDIIQTVDGVAYSTLEAASNGGGNAAIRGPVGTSVHLTVQSPDGKSRPLDLHRALVSSSTTTQSAIQVSRLPGTQVGLLAISSFNPSDLPTLIKTQLQRLLLAGPLEGLIIDVRRSAGGQSDDPMLATLALFNDGGSIGTYGTGKTGATLTIQRGATIPELKDLPTVVLTSHDMVGRPEVFALGMQISKRARVVGMPTAGTTGLSSIDNLVDGSQLRLAVSIYRRPDGSLIEGKGVQPDRVVDGKWYLYLNNPGDDPQIKAALDELKKK